MANAETFELHPRSKCRGLRLVGGVRPVRATEPAAPSTRARFLVVS